MKSYRIFPNEKFLRKVRPVLVKALDEAERILKPKKKINVYLSVTNDPFHIKHMDGAHGYATGGQDLVALVNTKAKKWKHGLRTMTLHEYNHAARHQAVGTEYSTSTVMDLIVLDGLAQVFEEEITGITPLYSKAVSLKIAKRVWEKIKHHLSEPADKFWEKAWIGGTREYPHWGGYTMSYLILKERKQELGLTWPELMKLSSKKLVGRGLD